MRSVLSVKWQASTGLAKKHITLTNCLLPLERGCGTCTILGNLLHSSFAIDPSMQRDPGAKDSTRAALLNCGALCFSSACGRTILVHLLSFHVSQTTICQNTHFTIQDSAATVNYTHFSNRLLTSVFLAQ